MRSHPPILVATNGRNMKKTEVKEHTRRTPKGRVVRVRKHTRKGKEFAPGIPSKKHFARLPLVAKPQHWAFVLHHHVARKRGVHYDLRLGRAGSAYSWVPEKWPEPGESVAAIEQPTHTQKYMGFEGEIPTGYGAGTVKIERQGPAIVYEAGPDKINFTLVSGKKTEDYVLYRIKGRVWHLRNYTLPSANLAPHQKKPKYLNQKVEKLDPNKADTIWSAKIDGAHGVAVLQGRKRPRIFSYRVPKAGGYIEWTHKMPGLFGQHVPGVFGNTVVRVEVYAKDKNGKPLPAERVAGMLNANTLKSRQKQKKEGKLRAALIDVIMWRGRDFSNATGEQKLQILEQIAQRMPYFELPEKATSPEEKTHLLEKIRRGKHHQTDEGVVQVGLKAARFTKGKFRPDHDVYVRRFTKARPGTKYEGNAVGGFEYSWTVDGPIVGRVGTGLSDRLRRDMYQHPDRFIGRVARVEGSKYKSGVGRTFAFKDWHPDKGPVGGYGSKELKAAEG